MYAVTYYYVLGSVCSSILLFSVFYNYILRCNGPELELLNNILEPLAHRGFQTSFNKEYPAAGLRSKITKKKAEVVIHKLFGKRGYMSLHLLYTLMDGNTGLHVVGSFLES